MKTCLGLFGLMICCAAQASAGDCTTPGTVLSSTTNVTVRASPPKERFLFIVGDPGKKVADGSAGEKFTVQDWETVPAAFRTDVWVRASNSKGLSGWIYCGTKDKLQNFEVKD